MFVESVFSVRPFILGFEFGYFPISDSSRFKPHRTHRTYPDHDAERKELEEGGAGRTRARNKAMVASRHRHDPIAPLALADAEII